MACNLHYITDKNTRQLDLEQEVTQADKIPMTPLKELAFFQPMARNDRVRKD